MNKIKLDGSVLKGLDGNPVLEKEELVLLKKQVAQILAMGRDGDAVKLWGIAQRFENQEEIELDDSDLKLVRQKIEDAQNATVMLKAQLLAMLEK